MTSPLPHQPIPVLEARGLSKTYEFGGQPFWAVKDASFSVERGECVALVGESGSGKTTLARMAVGLTLPDQGDIRINGKESVIALARSTAGRRRLSAEVQFVFQDSYGSLDPTKTVLRSVAEPLEIQRLAAPEIKERVSEALDLVRLPVAYRNRRPSELSGGQRQRVGIARALALKPSILVLDEPVASLDVSIQGQILSLLQDLRSSQNVTLLLIAHDLGVVRAVSDRTLVMYRGSIVEEGDTSAILSDPIHPYTQSLLWSISLRARHSMPEAARRALRQEATIVPLTDQGCVFRARCWRAVDRCQYEVDMYSAGPGRWACCNVPLTEEEAP